MSLSVLAVRIPETLHTYLKHKAFAQKKTLQELATEIYSDYQSKDIEYIEQLNAAGFASLMAVTASPADIAEEIAHDA